MGPNELKKTGPDPKSFGKGHLQSPFAFLDDKSVKICVATFATSVDQVSFSSCAKKHSLELFKICDICELRNET